MESVSFFAALIVGLLGGVHCIGMCGGIVSVMSLNVAKPSQGKIIWLNLAYNLGRIVSYVIAGAIAGGLGFLLIASTGGKTAQLVLHIFAALFILALGLYLAGFWQGLTYIERAGSVIWKRIAPLAQKFVPFRKFSQGFIAGILWGWLPCGLVYSVLVWSVSAATPLNGALYMLGFGLGTLPNLMLFGLFADRLRPYLQNKMVRVTAGMLLVGWALYKLYMIVGQHDG